ncbi:sugar kinase [Candidatus Woesearchaeota archaeon]|nr:sugar kinase [Candidatus Woesearchaeota archaeon]
MVELVIVGSVALDTVRTPFGRVESALGGAATYAGFAASFFSSPGLVAVVGRDFPGEHLTLLRKQGIDVSGVNVEGSTFRWEGFYEYDMNEAKTVTTELGSFASFSPVIPADYRRAKYVFLANIDPELQLKVFGQVDAPKLVAMDTMNFWIRSKRAALLEVIGKVDLLLLNDSEARQLFDTPSLVKAAGCALALGPKHVIIKKGEHGALMFSEGSHFSAPGYPLELIKDPTGCGDSFAGALMGYIAETADCSERNLRKAVVYGSVVASFNAEDFSLERLKRLSREEITKRYNEFLQMRSF